MTEYQIQKISLVAAAGLLSLLVQPVSTRAEEGESKTGNPVGVTSLGLHGIHRIAVPYAPERHITLSGQGGYGLTESVGDVDGAHHRLYGKIAGGFALLRWLGFGLYLDGYYDKHPDDDDGADTTLVGNPHLDLRFGYPLGKLVQIGADFDLWIPGDKAPSLKWDATTLDSRLLLALSPEDSFWTVAAAVGFRADNSANAAPPADTLRPGDRISLGVSEFHSVIVGLGSSLRFANFELLLEFTANLLVGDNAPTGSSPFRFAVGGRYRLTKALAIELMTESLAGKRPGLTPDDPMVPVDPRFSLLAGIRYTFALGKEPLPPEPKPESESVETVPTPPPVETSKSASTRLTGSVVDNDGNPIGGANIRLDSGGEAHEAQTDSQGNYFIDNVSVGPATLTVNTDGFDEDRRELVITEKMPAVEPLVMTQTEASQASQLRGIIRSIDGQPLRAQIIIKPSNTELETDNKGYFTVDLPPGQYTVTIKSKGYRRQQRKVEIEENSVTILNADLRIR